MSVKYPEISVKLVGSNGNAFAVMGLVSKALSKGGVSKEEIAEYQEKSMSGSYEQLLAEVFNWVSVE